MKIRRKPTGFRFFMPENYIYCGNIKSFVFVSKHKILFCAVKVLKNCLYKVIYLKLYRFWSWFNLDKAKKYLGELLEAIIIVAVLYTVFFPARVDGNSMENTLNDGDTIFVSRAAAFAGLYKNDDIIVFEHKKGK